MEMRSAECGLRIAEGATWPWVIISCRVCVAGCSAAGCLCCSIVHAREKASVVIYTSQDEEYADPIFKDFESRPGSGRGRCLTARR